MSKDGHFGVILAIKNLAQGHMWLQGNLAVPGLTSNKDILELGLAYNFFSENEFFVDSLSTTINCQVILG